MTRIREHINPVPLSILAEALEERVPAAQNDDYRNLSTGLGLFYDACFSQELERLKQLYHPFNPDRAVPVTPFDRGADPDALLRRVEALLQRANFIPLDQAAIEVALNKTSPHGVEVSVDLSEFQRVSLHYYGDTTTTVEPPWWKRWLGAEPKTMPVYRRLFLLLQPEDPEQPAPVYIKLFRDIPHSDLETLFPNTRVRLRRIDKIKLAVTGGGGAVTGIAGALGKLAAASSPVGIASALVAIAGVVWKQVSSVLTRRTQYMMMLARNLYFYNLDNNLGALAYLVEMASTEEYKEALLGYTFLLDQPGLTETALDRRVEDFMAETFRVQMDYEVHDGLGKLDQLGLLQREGDRLRVPPPEGALERLREHWSALFPP